MERKKYVIFTAGGSGTRMKSAEPKQFLPREHVSLWEDLCTKYPLDVPQRIVEGGITRFHSVKNALAKVPDGVVVAVHDGVRPLVSGALIKEMFSQMRSCRALIPVLPVTDTLKSLRRNPDGRIVATGDPDPDRSRVFGAQTPQMFLSEELRAAYELPYDLSYTDDASVAARYGIPLSYIDGERNNIKLTTPEDMELAAFFI